VACDRFFPSIYITVNRLQTDRILAKHTDFRMTTTVSGSGVIRFCFATAIGRSDHNSVGCSVSVPIQAVVLGA